VTQAQIAILARMLQRALDGIEKAVEATNGYADNDHRIMTEILVPCLNDLAAMRLAYDAVGPEVKP
jgi:hypothetical protein